MTTKGVKGGKGTGAGAGSRGGGGRKAAAAAMQQAQLTALRYVTMFVLATFLSSLLRLWSHCAVLLYTHAPPRNNHSETYAQARAAVIATVPLLPPLQDQA